MYDCPWYSFGPYALLVVQHVILQCIRQSGSVIHEASVLSLHDNLFAMFEVILDFPAHTLDWLESTSWNVSSFDIATTLIGCGVDYVGPIRRSFAEHAIFQPVPAAFLPSWFDDLDPALSWATQIGVQRKVQDRLQQRVTEARPLSVAMLNLHDASSWDQWQSLLAAMQPWFPNAESDDDLSSWIRPKWFFTRIHAVTSCPEGKELTANLVLPFDTLRKQFNLAQEGKVGLAEFREWVSSIWHQNRDLREADILLCSEAFILCPLLNTLGQRPMIGRFDMTLLNEWHFSRRI
jgi:hypothetical protein